MFSINRKAAIPKPRKCPHTLFKYHLEIHVRGLSINSKTENMLEKQRQPSGIRANLDIRRLDLEQ